MFGGLLDTPCLFEKICALIRHGQIPALRFVALSLFELIRPLLFKGAHRQKDGCKFCSESYKKCLSALCAPGLLPGVVLDLQCLHNRSLLDTTLL